jgi:hypothetical protein
MDISLLGGWLDDGFMGKSFRFYDLNQPLLLSTSLHDWLPEDHLARFLVDGIETLDLECDLSLLR